MQARVTQNGEILLPEQVRTRLNIKPGDSVDVRIEDARIVVVPHSEELPRFTSRIIADPITGLPTLTAGPGAPMLRNEDVEKMLAEFP